MSLGGATNAAIAGTLVREKSASGLAAATLDVAGGTSFGSKDVFIIQCHSESAKAQLKVLLSSFYLNPIVLGEANDRGMTISKTSSATLLFAHSRLHV